MGLEFVIWSVKKWNTVSFSHKWSKIDFAYCSNCFEMKSLIRQIEFEVHGRFNLEPFFAQNALKISEILWLCWVNLNNMKSIPTQLISMNMDQSEIFFPSPLQCLFFIDQNIFRSQKRQQKYISAQHKAKPQMLFSNASKYFGFSLFNFVLSVSLLHNRRIRISLVWKMIFWLSQQSTMAIMCGTIW